MAKHRPPTKHQQQLIDQLIAHVQGWRNATYLAAAATYQCNRSFADSLVLKKGLSTTALQALQGDLLAEGLDALLDFIVQQDLDLSPEA